MQFSGKKKLFKQKIIWMQNFPRTLYSLRFGIQFYYYISSTEESRAEDINLDKIKYSHIRVSFECSMAKTMGSVKNEMHSHR